MLLCPFSKGVPIVLVKTALLKLTVLSFFALLLSLTNTTSELVAAPPGFTPITPENISQIEPLASVARLNGDSVFVLFRPDGAGVLVDGIDAPPKYFDFRTGEERLFNPGDFYTIKWNPNSSSFVATVGYTSEGKRGSTILVDAASGNRLEVAPAGNELALFSPDGRVLISGAGAGAIRLWDTINHTIIDTIDNYVQFNDLAFSADGKYLAWLDFQQLVLWDIQAHREYRTLPCEGGRDNYPTCAYIFSADSSKIITFHVNFFQIWNVTTGGLLATINGGFQNLYDGRPYALGTPRPFYTSALISADGQHLLLRSSLNEPGSSFLQLWDIGNLSAISKIWQVDTSNDEVALSPDGSIVVVTKISRYLLL